MLKWQPSTTSPAPYPPNWSRRSSCTALVRYRSPKSMLHISNHFHLCNYFIIGTADLFKSRNIRSQPLNRVSSFGNGSYHSMRHGRANSNRSRLQSAMPNFQPVNQFVFVDDPRNPSGLAFSHTNARFSLPCPLHQYPLLQSSNPETEAYGDVNIECVPGTGQLPERLDWSKPSTLTSTLKSGEVGKEGNLDTADLDTTVRAKIRGVEQASIQASKFDGRLQNFGVEGQVKHAKRPQCSLFSAFFAWTNTEGTKPYVEN